MPAQRILYLLQLFFSNAITEKQKEDISHWIIQSKNNEEIIALLEKVWMNYVPDAPIPEDVSDKILEELFRTDTRDGFVQSPTPVISISPTHIWWKVAVAAASIIIVIAGTYVWFSPSKNTSVAKNAPHKPQVINDAVPGGQKAVLTLSDGTQILLDSASNGTPAQQRNAQVIKLSNGEISYKTDGVFSVEALCNTMSTSVGGMYQLILPDASKVLLNATSSIRYPTEFSGKERHLPVEDSVRQEDRRQKGDHNQIRIQHNRPSNGSVVILDS